MRHFVAISLTVMVSLLSVQFAPGDTTLYVSFSDFGGPDARQNTSADFLIGDIGSAFIWIETDTDIDTLSVANLLLNNASVVALTGAEVFNPDILLDTGGGTTSDAGDRWSSIQNGNPSVTGDSISGLSGFATNDEASPGSFGFGIRTSLDGSGSQTDQLFDATSNSFLFARVDFVANSLGSVQINPDGIFLNQGAIANFSVNSGTVNVVPEPTTAVLILAAGLSALTRRRRS